MKHMQTPFKLSFSANGKTWRTLQGGEDFRLDEACLSSFLYAVPSNKWVDLLRIATSVYVIDRLVKRRTKSNPRMWHRSIRVKMDLLEPDFWNSSAVCDLLSDCLFIVSGDSWDFEFMQHEGEMPYQNEGYLNFTDDNPLICLYSGGLDSAAGLYNRLKECPDRLVMPITVRHQPKQGRRIKQQFQIIKEKLGTVFSPLVVKVAMSWAGKKWKEESSQRCRSFLFAAVGALAAALNNASIVELYESGIGAINLPLMSGMIGSKATRSCHPTFLEKLSQLVSLVADKPLTFVLPLMDKTKGEIVKLLKDDGLEQLAKETVSCAHYPLREIPHKQCGTCPACIFRRQALVFAGIEEDKDTYKYDLFGTADQYDQTPEKKLKHLNAFLCQIVKLNGLDGTPDLPDWIRRHIFGTGILKQGDAQEPTINLLRRYRNEWHTIAAPGTEQELPWALRIASEISAN